MHEGGHHMDDHLNSWRTIKDRSGHDGAVLSEGVGQILPVLTPTRL